MRILKTLTLKAIATAGVRLFTLIFATACATTGATFRSGVGDAFIDAPPYYAGAKAIRDTAAIGHLPITYQRGGGQPTIFDPRAGAETPIGALLADMNTYLDSISVSTRLVDGGRVSAVTHGIASSAPDVQFGCEVASRLPTDDCIDRDGALGRGRLPMRLAVGRPSPEWISWNAEVMDACGVKRTLVITLEVGQYLVRQRGLKGSKEIDLGTGNVAKFPWLTSLETPVLVLQLTGALIDRDGKAVRIGAEGFYARRTRLLVSAIGGQELLTDDDVANARKLRRDDLPGAPIAWRVALDQLVAGLTGTAER
ncbi:MAG TPA: hypothetical protein VIP11_16185 [Gemmatimonadaceae bacterium]